MNNTMQKTIAAARIAICASAENGIWLFLNIDSAIGDGSVVIGGEGNICSNPSGDNYVYEACHYGCH